MKKIILASQSPRRLEILRNHGIEPIVMPSNAEEVLPDGIGMKEAVMFLAEQKARSVYDDILNGRQPDFHNENPSDANANNSACDLDSRWYSDSIIIGSDTIVYKNEIMGKPVDADDAFRMLSSIRGTVHYVVTGVALIDSNTGECELLCDITEVHCKNYTDEQIWEYIENEQPYDKAGSYAIQGPFGKYIDYIDGDYENVVGLPFHIIKPFLM